MRDIFASAGGTDTMPPAFDQLTMPQMAILVSKLCEGKRQALHVARQSRSLHEIWDMIRLINDLADVADDVSRALARTWPA
jgi:hypothetical protein